MFFPFLNYFTVDIDEDSNGDNLIYTTTARCIIMVGEIGSDPEGGSDFVRIYTPASGDEPEKVIYEVYGILQSADLNDGRARGLHILESGTPVRATRNNESIEGKLHVFVLP